MKCEKELVTALNLHGMPTVFTCVGHRSSVQFRAVQIGKEDMFEIGRHYKLVTWHSSDGGRIDTSSPSEVIEVSLPLVKFRTVPPSGVGERREAIVNTTSLAFVRAELIPESPPAPSEKPSVIVGKL